ncbi:MAG: cytochrome c oxidase assembly protein [Candidatus Dormibacteraeota bacterium]|nr:cytochrome c oxidase assembly protein [Candidatus Dormibacteraeota bacterium]
MIVADPAAAVAIGGAATAYWAGASRWRRQTGRAMVSPISVGFFFAGLAAVAVAVASPIDTLAERSLSAHMVQHVLLLSVAGPLLALGAPLPTLLWALPRSSRGRALSARRRLQASHDRHFPIWVAALLAVQAAVMWSWHLPDAYQAALRNPAIHSVEHLSFLLTSTAAWWSVVTGRRSRRGAAAIAALMGSVPGIMLGSAMVLAPNPWYRFYLTTTAASALIDQQVAGVIMWAFGGMATVIVGAGLFAAWLAGTTQPESAAPIPPLPATAGASR